MSIMTFFGYLTCALADTTHAVTAMARKRFLNADKTIVQSRGAVQPGAGMLRPT